ncbi:MAG: type II toxin-antitoxin system HicB family antitoxin [Methanothrix sp.]|nr:type II toxin-antitoxin system HicB family antitoxin [Methanothrix sp.]
MFCEYIHAALSKATYEIIEDEEPFYGEVPELRGVWAIGKTLEECRENLKGDFESSASKVPISAAALIHIS